MSEPIKFKVSEHCVVYRPTGAVSAIAFIDFVSKVIRAAREQGIDRVPVDSTAMELQFKSASVAERFHAASGWATAGAGKVQFALVLRGDLIDPQGFAATFARLAGLTSKALATQAEALAWFKTQTGA